MKILRCKECGSSNIEPSNRIERVYPETFEVEGDRLRRSRFSASKRKTYKQSCSKSSFEEIANCFEEFGKGEKVTLADICHLTSEPVRWTQVAVATSFLKERGILDNNGEILSGSVYLDAMTEYYALEEEENPE